jgi:two-component system, NarL family, invasion response regulator UvrY
MINLMIADDHPIVRKGIKQLFDETQDISVVYEVSNGQEIFNIIKEKKIDIVLLDISMPGRSGLDILKQLKNENPDIIILILSMYPEEQYAIRALKAGASGYITKESAPDELVNAVRKVYAGGKYVSMTLAEKLAYEFDNTKAKNPHEKLSDREFQVMCMIASGKSVTEISHEIFLSIKTISTYRTRILEKMNFKNNSDITRYALENHLV